jgi:hypothetical protein
VLDSEQTGATGERPLSEVMVSCTVQLDHLHELMWSRSMAGNVKARKAADSVVATRPPEVS